jgi:hypothetical protein
MNQSHAPNQSASSFLSTGVNSRAEIVSLFKFFRFANALVYYGVSYGSVDLGGNKYVNFALSSIVELPSNILCIVAADR